MSEQSRLTARAVANALAQRLADLRAIPIARPSRRGAPRQHLRGPGWGTGARPFGHLAALQQPGHGERPAAASHGHRADWNRLVEPLTEHSPHGPETCCLDHTPLVQEAEEFGPAPLVEALPDDTEIEALRAPR